MTYDSAFTLNGNTPPQNIEMEEAVLGALMLDQDALISCIESLHKEYFYKMEHQVIFQAIMDLFAEKKPVDLLSVTEKLRKDGKLEEAGGPYHLSELTTHVVSAAHIEYHVRVMSEKFIQRELIRISTETIKKAYDETTDVVSLLDETEQNLMDINDKNFRSDYKSMKDVMKNTFDLILHEKVEGEDDENRPVNTGFIDLDNKTSGFQPGTLLILAARPAMGKTALALSMARNIAVDFHRPIAFFSLEMTAEELAMRLISSESGIPGEKLKNSAQLSAGERQHIVESTRTLFEAPIYIDDSPQLSIFDLRAKCRRLKQNYHISMVFIDYLQLMQAGGEQSRNGNREQEISTISRQLKALSKELKIPVLALSQLSRAVETRGGTKEPMLSDLRESGAIEQDADIVIFIYRPEYYGITEDDTGSTIGMADVNLAKHRSGGTGKVRLRFVKEYARFENPEYNFNGTTYGSAMAPNAGFDGVQPQPGATSITIDSKMNSENDDLF